MTVPRKLLASAIANVERVAAGMGVPVFTGVTFNINGAMWPSPPPRPAWHDIGLSPQMLAVCDHLAAKPGPARVHVVWEWARISERVVGGTSQAVFTKTSHVVFSPGTVTIIGTTRVRVLRIAGASDTDAVALTMAGFTPHPLDDGAWFWIVKGAADAVELGERFDAYHPPGPLTRRERRAARPRFRYRWTGRGLTGGIKFT